MNKEQLCNTLSKSTKMSKTQCMRVIDSTFNAIEGALKKGQSVRLVGFGSWKKVRRKARPGRNPQTGKKLTIPARNVVKFTTGQNLFDQIN